MKIKRTILALSACSIAVLPAATSTPEKTATAITEKAEELKGETPVEKQAFKMLALTKEIPEILGTIKDAASLAAADAKLQELLKKMKAAEAALFKFEIPDNAARTKLSKKLAGPEEALQKEMMAVFLGIEKLPFDVALQMPALIEKIQTQANLNYARVQKYLKTDEELLNAKK